MNQKPNRFYFEPSPKGAPKDAGDWSEVLGERIMHMHCGCHEQNFPSWHCERAVGACSALIKIGYDGGASSLTVAHSILIQRCACYAALYLNEATLFLAHETMSRVASTINQAFQARRIEDAISAEIMGPNP